MVLYNTKLGKDTEYTAKEFADSIKTDPGYNGGNIRLLSCGAGSEESIFAQEFANEMNKEILAPTETLWVPIMEERAVLPETSILPYKYI